MDVRSQFPTSRLYGHLPRTLVNFTESRGRPGLAGTLHDGVVRCGHHSTLTVSGMLLVTVPLVAVTRMFVVPVWCVVDPLPPLPPQPESIVAVKANTANIHTTPATVRLPLDTCNASSIESTNNRMPQVPFQ